MSAEMLNKPVIEETSKFSTLASYMILEGELDSIELGQIGIQLLRIPYSLETEIERLKASDNPDKDKIIRKLQTAEP